MMSFIGSKNWEPSASEYFGRILGDRVYIPTAVSPARYSYCSFLAVQWHLTAVALRYVSHPGGLYYSSHYTFYFIRIVVGCSSLLMLVISAHLYFFEPGPV